MLDAGIDPARALAIRHAFALESEESGLTGLHANLTNAEIVEYTRIRSTDTIRFPIAPPRHWVVFIREGGDQARLWSVVENRGEFSRDEITRNRYVDQAKAQAKGAKGMYRAATTGPTQVRRSQDSTVIAPRPSS